jgi:hypothetical protein
VVAFQPERQAETAMTMYQLARELVMVVQRAMVQRAESAQRAESRAADEALVQPRRKSRQVQLVGWQPSAVA